MSREKRTGMIIMAVGICIPLLSLFFVAGYNPNQNLIKNIYSLGIPLGKQTVEKKEIPETASPKGKVTWETIQNMVPRSIGFRFILAFGILIIFAGFIRFDAARQRAKRDGMHRETDGQEDKGA